MRWLHPCIGLLGATLTLGCGNSDEGPNQQGDSRGPTSASASSNTATGTATSNSDSSAGPTSGAHGSTNTGSSNNSTSSAMASASTGATAAAGADTTSGAGGAGDAGGAAGTTDGSGGDDSATASTDSLTNGAGGSSMTGTASTTGEPDPCAVLSGQTYATVDELECGNTPAGPMYCTWTLSFTAVEFEWSRADTLQTGTYSCENGAISAEAAGQDLEGELHEDGSLTWEGQTYVQAD